VIDAWNGSVMPTETAAETRGDITRLHPWLVGVRVRELMRWLIGDRPVEVISTAELPALRRLMTQPIMAASAPEPMTMATAMAAAPAPTPGSSPAAAVQGRRRARPVEMPTGPIGLSSNFTMPERRVTIRRPAFEVTEVSPEAARVPRAPMPEPEPMSQPISAPLPPPPPAPPPPAPLPTAPALAEAPRAPQVSLPVNSLPPLPAALVDLTAARIPPLAVPPHTATRPVSPIAPNPAAQSIEPAPTAVLLPDPVLLDPVLPDLDLEPPMPLNAPQLLVPEALVPRARVVHAYVAPVHAPPDFPAMSPAPPPPFMFDMEDPFDAPELQSERPVASKSLRLPFTIAACMVAVLGGAAALLWGAADPADATILGGAASAFATADGRVAHILVAPGTRVIRGMDLFEIEPPPPDAARIAELEQRRDLARARAGRLESVAQELARVLAAARPANDVSARRDTEAARQRLRDVQDQARLASSEQSRLEADLATLRRRPEQPPQIRADRDGFITQVFVTEGQDVVPGLRVAEMADCNNLSLSLDAREAARAGLTGGRQAHIAVPVSKAELAVQVPEAGQRNAVLYGVRIQIPIDSQAWIKAGGGVCPLGMHVKVAAR